MFSSLRFRMNASVLIVLFTALVLINIITISAVGNSLTNQRFESQKTITLSAANEIGGYIAEKDWQALHDYCIDFGEKNYCRVLVFNTSAAVISDNYSELYGRQFANKELNSCLIDGVSYAYGTYLLPLEDSGSFVSKYIPYEEGRKEYWTLYAAARLENNNETVGALLISVPFQDLVDEVSTLSLRIVGISVFVGIVISVLLIMLMRSFFAPLYGMTAAIGEMSKGNFGSRISIGKSKGELSELADTFNKMSARMELLEESRNNFVSDASHEMKTPLATMKILVDSLLSQPDVDKEVSNEFLGDVSHEIDRLNYLINDLLTLVRMDKTEVHPSLVPIQITDLLDKVRHKLQPLAAMKGITIYFKAEGDPTVLGDAMKLQQAFSNLVDNAIKYSAEDTGITISLTKDNQNAIIAIADQGIGISQEDQVRIFERFYRVDKARSRETGGTGLGLSIVDNIVKAHGGNISIASRKDEGSTFTVILPLQTQK